MVFGIGTDIVAVERFKKLKNKDEFLAEFLSSDELSRAPKAQPDLFFATLFAAKESVLKALGCGLSQGSYWQHVKISRDHRVSLSGPLLELLPRGSTPGISLSVSKSGEYAIAYAIVEIDNG
jgi:holo-[acyl-carrier protein] synthase